MCRMARILLGVTGGIAAYKACEPHVVLLALTVLALLAAVAPGLWQPLWVGGVLTMVILAPTLAIGRAARAIARGRIGL